MRHTRPGSASVVSCATIGKMETIDRMRLIHCVETPAAVSAKQCVERRVRPLVFFSEPFTGVASWKGE